MDKAIEAISQIIQDNLEIGAAIDPETGKVVLIQREGTYEKAAKAVLDHMAGQ